MFEQVVGTAVAYLDLNTTAFNTKLDSAWKQLNSIGDGSLSLGNKLQGVGQGMQTIGNEMTRSFTVPIVGAFGVAIAKTTDFEKAMSTVQSLAQSGMKDVTKETDLLRQKALELGGSTKFTSKEVADAFSYMALAGWDTQQMLEGISGVLDLAASSDMDLAKASDIVTDYLTAFGKEASYSATMADMLSYAQANSNTTTIELGDAFRNAAANMNASGQTMDTTIALLEAMANQGTKGAQAGTALSATMRDLTQKMFKYNKEQVQAYADEEGLVSVTGDLADVTDTLSIKIGKTLIPVQDAQGNFRDLIDILGDVETATQGLGTAQRSAALMDTFTSRSIKVVNEALVEGVDNIRKYRDELNGQASGTAAEQAKTRLDNLAGSITLLKSALDNLFIKLGERLTPYIRKLADFLTEITSKLASMSDEEFDKIIKIAAAIAALGPTLSILGKLVSLLGGLMNILGPIAGAITGTESALAGLSGVIGVLTAPITAVVAIIGVLAGAFITLWKTSEDFRNSITETWEGLKEKFSEAGQKIVDAFNKIGFEFEDVMDILTTAWNAFCELLAPAFEAAFEIISTVIGWAANWFADLIEIITGLIQGLKTGDWSLFWEGVSDIVSDTVEAIMSVLDSLAEFVWDTIQTIGNWLGADWTMSWDEAKEAFVLWMQSIGQWFEDTHEKIQDFFYDIAEWIVELPDKIVEAIGGLIESIAEWGSNLVEKGKEAGSNFVDSVVEWFDQLPYKIGYAIGYVLATVAQWVNDMVDKAIEFGTNFIQAIIEWFEQLPENIETFINNAYETITKFVSDSIEKAIELGTEFVGNVIEWFEQLPEKIEGFIKSTLQKIIKFKDDAKAKAKETGENFIKNVIEFIKSLPDKVKEFLDKTIENLKQWILDMGKKGKEAVEELIKNIVETAKSIPEKVMEIGENIVKGVWEGIEGAKDWFKDKIHSFFSGLVDGAKDALGISSPSKVFANEVGKWIPLGIAEGVEDEMPEAAKDIQDSIEEGMEEIDPEVKLKTSVDTFGDTFVTTFNDLLSWIEVIEYKLIDSINNMTNALTRFASTANNLLSMNDIAEQYRNIGMLSNQGEQYGIQAMLEDMFVRLKEFISEVANVSNNTEEGMTSGDIIIPVYIGNTQIDELIVNAQQRQNYISGGR